MNTPSELRAEHTVDLSRLNDAERGVLRLLAEGHTAKSIANSIGSSPAAVNERLREARRKTGVASSRELARLLKAQENRDEQFGVATATAAGASPSHESAKPRRRAMGVIVMFALLGVAAAVFISTQSPVAKSAPQTITDPQLGTFEVVGPTWLYRGIRQEDKDIPWAVQAEQTLKERYNAVRFFGEKPQLLRVMCEHQTCEVAAVIPEPKLHSSYGDEEKSISADMRKKGLIQAGAAITNDRGSKHIIYLAYYLRSADGGAVAGHR